MAFNDTLRILLPFLFLTQCLQNFVRGEPQVPCYFIFGDSLVDSGNNNQLNTQAKANYLPYGVDFPEGFTGRFTNNRTITDIIGFLYFMIKLYIYIYSKVLLHLIYHHFTNYFLNAMCREIFEICAGQLLGFEDFIPPFANKMEDIIRGVNYASAVSGIRDETGKQQGDRIPLNEQLRNHLITVLRITKIMKSASAARQYLQKCIYVVITGNNDYINNYFVPDIYPTSRLYTPQQFADGLARQYSNQLKDLYFSGARKVAIFGVGLIGLTPEIIGRFGANYSMVNDAAQLFSNKLLPLVNDLNSHLTGAKFTYINTTGITVTSNDSLSLLNTQDTCCPVVQDLGTCVPGSTPCTDRTQYAYFDGFHPTDVVNEGFAGRAYNEKLPSDASPYDISRLARL
ncbi:hypothetical protein CDL15_Pgr027086 [Punica granatum]|uniref:GDSL esterase/lipase At1g29670-like n=1 Tax=Punica granatum TaxID=22663 RepID=A0A218XH83_PUNGR|nr:hypothetical protein CDL15_Pgr027086 [Punica granatum]